MKHLLLTLLMIGLLTNTGCVTYIGVDGPYEGKIVDGDTGLPVEGAVVHGAWVKGSPGPGGATHTFYDSREVLTDKNGEFKIMGQGLQIFSSLEPIQITILKAGYTQISEYIWGFTTDSNVTILKNTAVFKLRRMADAERKTRSINSPIMEPTEKYKLLIMETNKENFEIGKPTHPLFPITQ